MYIELVDQRAFLKQAVFNSHLQSVRSLQAQFLINDQFVIRWNAIKDFLSNWLNARTQSVKRKAISKRKKKQAVPRDKWVSTIQHY